MERPSIQLHGNRVAVFSDIHSNYYALEVCYANTHPDAFTDEKVWQKFALELKLPFTEAEVLTFARKQGLIP